MADPYLSAQTAETDLRELVRLVLEPALGSMWLEHSGIFMPEQIKKIARRRDDERDKRPGVGVEESLVFYIDLWDLISITKRHWPKFKNVLGPNEERWHHESQVLHNLRNAQAHGRVLAGFERDLLSGIAGEIRNRVTRHRSEMDPQETWWPRIESVHDSFGNDIRTGGRAAPTLTGTVETHLVLHVGDTVMFECAGWDPQDRPLNWRLNAGLRRLDEAEGNNVTLSGVVTEDLIGGQVWFGITLITNTSYHRMHQADDVWSFGYAVRPPRF